MKNLILVIAGLMIAAPMVQANDTSTLGAIIESATQIASSHEGYAEAFIGGRVEIDQNVGKIRLYPRLYTADAPPLVLSITEVTQLRSGAIVYEGIRKVMGFELASTHHGPFARDPPGGLPSRIPTP